jgi:hypothetical protein
MLNEGSHPLPYQPYEGPVTHDGSLAAVAKSGEYSDLKDKPALFSGSYNDLTNKPTIPSAVTVKASRTIDYDEILSEENQCQE